MAQKPLLLTDGKELHFFDEDNSLIAKLYTEYTANKFIVNNVIGGNIELNISGSNIAVLSSSEIDIYRSIIPQNTSLTIGDSTHKFANIYLSGFISMSGTLPVISITATGDYTDGAIKIKGAGYNGIAFCYTKKSTDAGIKLFYYSTDDKFYIRDYDSNSNFITIDRANSKVYTDVELIAKADIRPDMAETYSLGTSTYYWDGIHVSEAGMYIHGSNDFTVAESVSHQGSFAINDTALIVDVDNNRVGINVGSDTLISYTLDVDGDIRSSEKIVLTDSLSVSGRDSNLLKGVELRGVTSSAILTAQDGTGRFVLKWNASYGNPGTYLVSDETAVKIAIDPYSGENWYLFRISYGTDDTPTAGNNVTWGDLIRIGTSGINVVTGDIYRGGTKVVSSSAVGGKTTHYLTGKYFLESIQTSEPTPASGEAIWYVYDSGSAIYVKVAVYVPGVGVQRYTIKSWTEA